MTNRIEGHRRRFFEVKFQGGVVGPLGRSASVLLLLLLLPMLLMPRCIVSARPIGARLRGPASPILRPARSQVLMLMTLAFCVAVLFVASISAHLDSLSSPSGTRRIELHAKVKSTQKEVLEVKGNNGHLLLSSSLSSSSSSPELNRDTGVAHVHKHDEKDESTCYFNQCCALACDKQQIKLTADSHGREPVAREIQVALSCTFTCAQVSSRGKGQTEAGSVSTKTTTATTTKKAPVSVQLCQQQQQEKVRCNVALRLSCNHQNNRSAETPATARLELVFTPFACSAARRVLTRGRSLEQLAQQQQQHQQLRGRENGAQRGEAPEAAAAAAAAVAVADQLDTLCIVICLIEGVQRGQRRTPANAGGSHGNDALRYLQELREGEEDLLTHSLRLFKTTTTATTQEKERFLARSTGRKRTKEADDRRFDQGIEEGKVREGGGGGDARLLVVRECAKRARSQRARFSDGCACAPQAAAETNRRWRRRPIEMKGGGASGSDPIAAALNAPESPRSTRSARLSSAAPIAQDKRSRESLRSGSGSGSSSSSSSSNASSSSVCTADCVGTASSCISCAPNVAAAETAGEEEELARATRGRSSSRCQICESEPPPPPLVRVSNSNSNSSSSSSSSSSGGLRANNNNTNLTRILPLVVVVPTLETLYFTCCTPPQGSVAAAAANKSQASSKVSFVGRQIAVAISHRGSKRALARKSIRQAARRESRQTVTSERVGVSLFRNSSASQTTKENAKKNFSHDKIQVNGAAARESSQRLKRRGANSVAQETLTISDASAAAAADNDDAEQQMNEQLLELLAQFYAHTEYARDRYRLLESQWLSHLSGAAGEEDEEDEEDEKEEEEEDEEVARSFERESAEPKRPVALGTTNQEAARNKSFSSKDHKKESKQEEEERAQESKNNNKHKKLTAATRRRLEMLAGSDAESLLRWLSARQDNPKFSRLKNVSIELVSERPNGTIHVCQDGPKILLMPNASDYVYCYTREQWISRLWSDWLRLSGFHYPIILLNILIFLIGTTGNIFVCLSVKRNLQLRSVTNYFIVNLAFADFLVILICLPATVVWDLSLTWFFGTIPCKLIMFLQDVSISVSVLTLTAISIDRYYAICHPLKFKTSLNQAKNMIALIWLVSLLIMAPDLIYLSAKPSADLAEAGLETVLYNDCNYDWSTDASRAFQFVKTVLLYLVPFLLMFIAHYRILQVLRLASSMMAMSGGGGGGGVGVGVGVGVGERSNSVVQCAANGKQAHAFADHDRHRAAQTVEAALTVLDNESSVAAAGASVPGVALPMMPLACQTVIQETSVETSADERKLEKQVNSGAPARAPEQCYLSSAEPTCTSVTDDKHRHHDCHHHHHHSHHHHHRKCSSRQNGDATAKQLDGCQRAHHHHHHHHHHQHHHHNQQQQQQQHKRTHKHKHRCRCKERVRVESEPASCSCVTSSSISEQPLVHELGVEEIRPHSVSTTHLADPNAPPQPPPPPPPPQAESTTPTTGGSKAEVEIEKEKSSDCHESDGAISSRSLNLSGSLSNRCIVPDKHLKSFQKKQKIIADLLLKRNSSFDCADGGGGGGNDSQFVGVVALKRRSSQDSSGGGGGGGGDEDKKNETALEQVALNGRETLPTAKIEDCEEAPVSEGVLLKSHSMSVGAAGASAAASARARQLKRPSKQQQQQQQQRAQQPEQQPQTKIFAHCDSANSANAFILTMHNASKLESRRKAAKMLTAIVILFGICYLPVHLINFLRQFIDDIPQTDVTSTISMLAHCVCYLNSAINPIIYNHMNSVFRAEFKKFLSCLDWRSSRHHETQKKKTNKSKHQLDVVKDSYQKQQQQQQQQDNSSHFRLAPAASQQKHHIFAQKHVINNNSAGAAAAAAANANAADLAVNEREPTAAVATQEAVEAPL